MASLAIPFIETAAARVIVALGVGGAAGLAGEAARQRQKEADQAKTTPLARTAVQTKAKEKCKECPPDKGAPFNRATAGWSDISIAYQARIGGLPVGAGFITEWLFNGVTFDGFDSSQCMLKEAKARYDQFFDEFGVPEDFFRKGTDTLINEAARQAGAAQPRPPVRLRWYFMQPKSYRFFSKIIQAAYPDVEVVFEP